MERGAKSLKTNIPRKTAKRKRRQALENTQNREMPDSMAIMISMTCRTRCETFRFAWRNERFVLGRFSRLVEAEAKSSGRPPSPTVRVLRDAPSALPDNEGTWQ
jgi:hypothetical protein